MLTIRKARKDELALLTSMQEASFETTSCYFPNGVIPEPPPEEKEAHSFEKLMESPEHTILALLLDSKITGGAVVKDHGNGIREIELFFIQAENIGKGMGTEALKLVEAYFPDTRVWRLITPTQVMKNVVFYVNKCGYHIVRVEHFDREKNAGIYVFEKTGNACSNT